MNKLGLTLIEILIVISLLAIVTLVVLPNLRKFNEDQDLIIASNSLKQVLRLAQSSANSGIKCSSKAANSWKVTVLSAQFTLVALCIDPFTQASPSPESRSSSVLPSNITVFDDNCKASTASVSTDIIFTAGDVNFICLQNGSAAISPYTITLKSAKTNQTTVVTINKGGTIY